jgi:hypothetical protein
MVLSLPVPSKSFLFSFFFLFFYKSPVKNLYPNPNRQPASSSLSSPNLSPFLTFFTSYASFFCCALLFLFLSLSSYHPLPLFISFPKSFSSFFAYFLNMTFLFAQYTKLPNSVEGLSLHCFLFCSAVFLLLLCSSLP